MISIIVPAHNEGKTIGACLDGLLAQTTGRDAEIIVVDDGSTDATREIAQSRNVRVLTQANRGAAAARNLGAQNARGDIVLFIDGDCTPHADWVEAMTTPFADSAIVGVGGMKQTHQQGLMPRFIQMEFDYRYDQVRAHQQFDLIDSGTAAYRREVFLQHGGFDTYLADAEDVDLSWRLSEHGHRMAFAPSAAVYCVHPESLWEYLRRKFTYAYWRSFVYARFPRKVASDSRTPQTQKIQALLAGLLPPALLVSLLYHESLWLAALIVVVFMLTTLPFVTRYFARSWQVSLVAPLLIGLAAFAVGAGVAWGVVRQRTSRG